jgi:thymidylate kinase
MSVASAPSVELIPSAASRVLRPLRELHFALESSGVRYCHWKGNAHLSAVLAGDKDCDILVERDAAIGLPGLLDGIGFRRVCSPPSRESLGIEHHLAFDEETGRLVHLHLHLHLAPTKSNYAGYCLPWEELLLSTRRLHETGAMYVASPTAELLVYLVRAALRLRLRDRIAERFGRAYLRGAAQRELEWLTARADKRLVTEYARSVLGPRAVPIVARAVDRGVTADDLHLLKHRAEPRLDEYRTFGAIATFLRRTRARLLVTPHMISGLAPRRRILPQGGRIVAIVGSDGAGKSTVARQAASWLSQELDTLCIYFGSGEGPASLTRHALRSFDRTRRVLTGQRASPRARSDLSSADRYVGGVDLGLRAFWKIASKLALAREKEARLRTARRARSVGMVVICDRFPQTQLLGLHDGPLLSPWRTHSSRVLRAAADREHRVYQQASIWKPDLVLKLLVSPAVAARRKSDMTFEELRARIEGLRNLTFPGSQVIEIDADLPLVEVMSQVKRALWGAL